MGESPLTDAVARQYERWVYPAPVNDLEAANRVFRQTADPTISHQVFWPDRDYREDLSILVAGCGSYQAAHIAFNNRRARVVGIDVSEASLARERSFKERFALDRLELHRLPIEEACDLAPDFDLIVASGVLHHMADPTAGLRQLGALLKPDGVAFILVYGTHGRAGLAMLQSAFGLLGLSGDATSIGLARETIGRLRADHPARNFLDAFSDDLSSDAGFVDALLNARERSYTVPGCLKLVADAGLAFQGWYDEQPYRPETLFSSGSDLYRRLVDLPREQMWQAMDLLTGGASKHTFLACRPERPVKGYTVDFETDAFWGFIPSVRAGVSLSNASLRHLMLDTALNVTQESVFAQVDGRRTIREIMMAARGAGVQGSDREAEIFARDFFRSLRHLGVLAFRIQGGD